MRAERMSRGGIGLREHFVKSILWFAVGVAAGFVAAHQFNQTNQGREFFSSIDAKARAFGQAIAEGYHERDAELRADGHVPSAPTATR
ncbi:hypothetical protein ACFWN7_01180 [Agromyces sp. NPDC058484]|uniref:hypothetical protein n=1 Tax=Agromyces sp. NPDC058484 TaxID=3346524 RepID=UPI00366A1A01